MFDITLMSVSASNNTPHHHLLHLHSPVFIHISNSGNTENCQQWFNGTDLRTDTINCLFLIKSQYSKIVMDRNKNKSTTTTHFYLFFTQIKQIRYNNMSCNTVEVRTLRALAKTARVIQQKSKTRLNFCH